MVKLENDDAVFQASLQGIDLRSASQKEHTSEPRTKSEPAVPLFGDPEKYENMSEQERHEQTEKMMSRHKKWVSEKKA